MKQTPKDLLKFLKPYPEDVQKTTLSLRKYIWERYPESNELIFDSYNNVTMKWSLTEKVHDSFISLAVYSDHVNLGFHRGKELEDPKHLLEGTGRIYRYIKVHNGMHDITNNNDILDLMDQANIHELFKMKKRPTAFGRSIVKSVSPSKRRPIHT